MGRYIDFWTEFSDAALTRFCCSTPASFRRSTLPVYDEIQILWPFGSVFKLLSACNHEIYGI